MFTAVVQNKAKTLPRSEESRDVKDRKGHPVCHFFSAHSPLLPFSTDFFKFFLTDNCGLSFRFLFGRSFSSTRNHILLEPFALLTLAFVS